MFLTVPKGETLGHLDWERSWSRGDTLVAGVSEWDFVSGRGCGECQPLHDQPELVHDYFLS